MLVVGRLRVRLDIRLLPRRMAIMRWKNARQSQNVVDRRGKRGGKSVM